MRKRLRSDWLMLVYKYRAYYHDPIPDFLWEHVSSQRMVWNRMVERLDEALEAWPAIKSRTTEMEEAAAGTPEEEAVAASAKAMRDEFWEAFWNDCDAVVEASELNWEAGPDVMDRFRTAVQEFFRNPDRGRPQPREPRTDSINVVHRFTGGGLPVENLFGTRGWRFKFLEAPPEDAYDDESRENRRRRIVPARFGIDGSTWEFRVRLHRPFPQGAIAKRVAWLGETRLPAPGSRPACAKADPPASARAGRQTGRTPDGEKWVWHLAIWLEIPPGTWTVKRPSEPAYAMDVGWRDMGKYLRIGMLRDAAGNRFEIRLPHDQSNYYTRRHGLPSSWRDKWGLDSQIGQQVELAKMKVREALDGAELPEEIKRRLTHLQKMRQGGLTSLLGELRRLEDTEYWGPAVADAVDALEAWREHNAELAYQARELARRLVRRREWIYGNLAAWLTKTYAVIAWEGDLDLKGMREDPDREPALVAAAKNAQIAALGDKRQRIENAAAKYGAEILPLEAAGTTNRCWLCGEPIEVGPALKLMCAGGHLIDQDVNAVERMWSEIPAELQGAEGLPEGWTPEIPEQLAGIVMPWHGGR